MAIEQDCCWIGRGEIFLRRCLTQAEIDAGVTSEYVSVGNTENFEVTSEVNTIVKKNYISKVGGVECTYSSLDDVQLNLTLCCYTDGNLALALAADVIDVPEVAAAPGVAATTTVTWNVGDTPVYTVPADMDQTAAFSATVTSGSNNGSDITSFFDLVNGQWVYNQDHTVSAGNGPLEPDDGNQDITFGYTTLATEAVSASKKFNLFSRNSDVYELQFRACNAAKGGATKTYTLDLYKVCFEPASTFQFITEEFGTIELTGRLLPDRTRMISDGTTDFPSEYGAWCVVEEA